MAISVLIVEDDNNIAELLQMFLEKEGYAVTIAPDGGQGVSKFRAIKPDMVLLDLGMDGIEPVTLGDIATVVVTDNAGELHTKVNGDNGILITFT